MNKEIFPIFKCEAVKSFSGFWVLTKVLNDVKIFKQYDIFDGDFLNDNVSEDVLNSIDKNFNRICFDVRVVEEDIDIHNIERCNDIF